MTAKRISRVPAVAPISETALAAALVPAQTDADGEAAGLIRTLARSRGVPEIPDSTKASTLAKLAKTGAGAKAKPGRSLRKKSIGPRSGHK